MVSDKIMFVAIMNTMKYEILTHHYISYQTKELKKAAFFFLIFRFICPWKSMIFLKIILEERYKRDTPFLDKFETKIIALVPIVL